MTFEELQDLLAEQFSCDTGDLSRGTALADLGADHEDMIELAWSENITARQSARRSTRVS